MDKELRADTPDDENPEWTEESFAQARLAVDIPALAHLAKPGRPALPEAEKKQRVTMYLDRDVIETLKQGGRGWQTRANAKLREVLGL
ncbi:MAG: BrnA antitoxin family protein [Mangrovicoccus sp.]